ncbi:MAG: fluoride efflux transporter CrcB [Thermodesulfobacteriota bacterium]|jgi:CrcB protein
MLQIILIGFGGAIGALSRYTLSNLISKSFQTNFPLGTLGVNLLGCFIIGIVWQFSEHYSIEKNLRLFFFLGLLGAFTTFSTFGLESLHLFKDGYMKSALLNIFLNNILGIVLVLLGIYIYKIIFIK